MILGHQEELRAGEERVIRRDARLIRRQHGRLVVELDCDARDPLRVGNLRLKGRLRSGVSQTEAQAELNTIAADLQRAYPDTNRNRGFTIRTELQSRISEDPPDSMLIAMLSTLAFAVLLVACGNVAGLLTSRAPVRAREMALRLAIGAGRGRLVRQLVTESLLIAIAGGVVGLGVGYAGMRLFRQIEIPTDLPVTLAFRMDRRALLFGLAVAVVSAVVFGLVPAIQATRTDLTAVMKATDTVASGRRRRWGRAVLVGGQIAVSVVLLVVAMFMYRGFRQNMAGGPGFRTDHLLMMSFDPTLMHYSEDQSRRFFEQVAERARAVPGVKAATMTSSVPMANDINTLTVAPEGFQFQQGKENVTVLAAMVDEHYFSTLGIPLVEGRNFRVDDDENAPRVAIANQHFVQHYWPGQDALGRRFRLNDAAKSWVEIVGVAKDSKYIFVAEAPSDFLYIPHRQRRQRDMVMVAQSVGDSASLAAPLREVVRGLDPNLPIFNVRTMEEFYRMRAVSIFNVLITIVAAMGLMGLGLAIIGLYGLVAFAAARRTREIGIRMAIGATQVTVLRMVLRQGFVLALVGLVIGLAASVGAGELLAAAFPTGDDQRDLMALVLVAPFALAVTILAAYIPARRASRVSPMQALRYE
jgi:predicted permease